jgi:hypothetical protein
MIKRLMLLVWVLPTTTLFQAHSVCVHMRVLSTAILCL